MVANGNPTLGIIVVNWNAGEQLLECLESIAMSEWAGICFAGVIVVDNASGDNSSDYAKAVRLPIRVIENEANVGFAVACNQAARTLEVDS